MAKLLRVRARDGVTITAPRGSIPGGAARRTLLRGKGAPDGAGGITEEADKPIEVFDSTFWRRQITNQDAELVEEKSTTPRRETVNARSSKSPDLAARGPIPTTASAKVKE